MDYRPDPDLLSDLPLSIIHIILALVPIREAVRTSILSRKWRYTWASLPQLVFHEYYTSPCPNYRSKLGFERYIVNSITHALFRHSGPIQKFEMFASFRESYPKIDNWVQCLSRKDIRELILYVGESNGNRLQLHSSIYSCKKLTYLKLYSCKLDPPPSTFEGFLFLRRLVLLEIYLSPSEIESLVSSCPLLERLELADARETELRISSPNLKYLHLDGCYKEICLNTPLLEQLLVLFLYDYDYQDVSTEKSSVCNYTNFFGGITNLNKLIGVYFTKFLSVGIEYCHRSVVLHHLKAIELNSVNSEDIKEILVVARLIIGAPNLHKLKIELIGGGYGASEAEDLCFKGFGCAPNFTLEKLRIVEVSGVRGLFAEKELIKFLLESSVVLDMMTVYHIFTPFCTDEIQDLRDELLGCSRASPRAKISISFSLV